MQSISKMGERTLSTNAPAAIVLSRVHPQKGPSTAARGEFSQWTLVPGERTLEDEKSWPDRMRLAITK
jgi:hypothetical protein